MTPISFQSDIKDNVIEIPQQYRSVLPAHVFVTIMDSASIEARVYQRRKNGGVTANDFKAVQIDTDLWEFDREKANER
ncbi:hypothetical protein NO1_2057 [Candidatus Termititenax aidoneus]|uniref:Uncharacterized protein n=1 Tax=Termititenax aidoneus TaxID=2218524 RepID=A0A388TDG0_TERA1|nr:hypothetical protein NO1_2057 [Candidatus Termititenax aidoneus]